MSERVVRVGTDDPAFDDAVAVRFDVFVDGQGVSEDVELDGEDDAATHFLAYDGADAVGTARLRELDAGLDDVLVAPDAVSADRAVGKVERVAVRERYRGQGWGRRLMEAVEREATRRDLGTLVLHGQTRVEEFYERLGYETVSGEFVEADIPHVEMVKRLD